MEIAQPRQTHSTRSPLWCAWTWLIIGCVGALDAIWLSVTPLSLAPSSYVLIMKLIPLILLGVWVSPRLDYWPRFRVIVGGLSLLLVAWPVLRLYNHLTMSTAFPLADAKLAAADVAIGFDWLGYVRWVDRHPHLIEILTCTYTNLTNYSIMLFVVLALGRASAERCAELIELFVITALTCSTIGMFYPALSAVIYHSPAPGLFKHIAPLTGAYHLEALYTLRSNSAAVLDLGNMPGLVTFPSFHTAMGCVAIYSARKSVWTLVPSMLFNIVMIASTPVFGAHYGIDIIAGAVAAAAAIYARATALRLRSQHVRARRFLPNRAPDLSRLINSPPLAAPLEPVC